MKSLGGGRDVVTGTRARSAVAMSAGPMSSPSRPTRSPTATPSGTTVTLPAGSYTMTVTAYRSDGKPLTPVSFQLQLEMLTNPVGPRPDDPTTSPSSSPSTGGTANSTSSGSPPPPSSDYYSWDWSGSTTSYGGPSYDDPYASSYTA